MDPNRPSLGIQKVYSTTRSTVQKVASESGAQHSFADEEKEAFADHVNASFRNDPDLRQHLPLDPKSMDLFKKLQDGILICKMINKAAPGTIDERRDINKPARTIFQQTENLNLAINSARAIGCNVVNIGAGDFIEHKVHLVLGLLWQIIQAEVLAPVSLKEHPELVRLLEEGETIADLKKLPPEVVLRRWVNYHLRAAGSQRRLNNFSQDVRDGEIYTVLLNQVGRRDGCNLDPLKLRDPVERGEAVLKQADKIRCRKFVSAFTIASGHPRLNLGFVATIFNERPGLEPATVEERFAAAEMLKDEDSEGSREERAFRIWINGLGLEEYVTDLGGDLRDGIILLRAMDRVMEPGAVDWRRVSTGPLPLGRFKAIENCNQVVEIGKRHGFSLVGVQGSDITDGNLLLTLAVVWQIMRHHTLSVLRSISVDGRRAEEKDLIAWANSQVVKSGKRTQMASFKDPTLKNGRFLLDLLASTEPRAVNWDYVTPGDNDEERMGNAKYVISVARRLGVSVFCVWEDIVQVKPKMMLTLVGGIMAHALRAQAMGGPAGPSARSSV
eukprot:tig00000881_g5246.t1